MVQYTTLFGCRDFKPRTSRTTTSTVNERIRSDLESEASERSSAKPSLTREAWLLCRQHKHRESFSPDFACSATRQPTAGAASAAPSIEKVRLDLHDGKGPQDQMIENGPKWELQGKHHSLRAQRRQQDHCRRTQRMLTGRHGARRVHEPNKEKRGKSQLMAKNQVNQQHRHDADANKHLRHSSDTAAEAGQQSATRNQSREHGVQHKVSERKARWIFYCVNTVKGRETRQRRRKHGQGQGDAVGSRTDATCLRTDDRRRLADVDNNGEMQRDI